MSPFLKNIEDQIASNKISQAISEMRLKIDKFRNNDNGAFHQIRELNAQLLVLSSKFAELNRRIDLGNYSFDEINIEKSKIVISLLNLAMELEGNPDFNLFISTKIEQGNKKVKYMLALANELKFNLIGIKEFQNNNYNVKEEKIMRGNAEIELFRTYTCLTSVFESNESQSKLMELELAIQEDVIKIYHKFREINELSETVKAVFRIWRVQNYLNAIDEFDPHWMQKGEVLVKRLLTLES